MNKLYLSAYTRFPRMIKIKKKYNVQGARIYPYKLTSLKIMEETPLKRMVGTWTGIYIAMRVKLIKNII